MAHLEPDDRPRTTDYLDRSEQSLGWAPVALLAATSFSSDFSSSARDGHRKRIA